MGVVQVTQEIMGEWEDLNGVYPYARATLYIYCDACGSFSIRTRLGYRKASLIMFAAISLTAGIWATFEQAGGALWLGLALAVCILAFRYLWGSPDYVCRKCGSVPTTRFNTRDYPPSDISILDVPDRMIQKKIRGYFPDDCNLDEELRSPEGLFSEGDSMVARIRDDVGGVKTTLLSILFIPLAIILTVVYPIGLILYLVWTEVVSKAFGAMSSKEHA